MRVLVECRKGTKEKYEISKDRTMLEVNRMLKRRWVANYGFVPDTLQLDGDELDAYIIGKRLEPGKEYDVLPVCVIYVYDNGEVDNKMVCIHKSAKLVKYHIRQIVRFIRKYKKDSVPVMISYRDDDIRMEYAKCKAFRKIFGGIV